MTIKNIAAAAVLAALAAHAQAGSFDGTSAQLGLGVATKTSNWEDEYVDLRFGDTGINAVAAVGYSRELRPSLNLAASLFYMAGSSKAGRYGMGGDSMNSKLKNTWGVTVEPGYYLAEKTLGYVKLGWAATSASISYPGGEDYKFGTVNGPLLGVGMRQQLSPKLSVGVEAYHIRFGSKDSAEFGLNMKSAITYGGANLAYQF